MSTITHLIHTDVHYNYLEQFAAAASSKQGLIQGWGLYMVPPHLLWHTKVFDFGYVAYSEKDFWHLATPFLILERWQRTPRTSNFTKMFPGEHVPGSPSPWLNPGSTPGKAFFLLVYREHFTEHYLILTAYSTKLLTAWYDSRYLPMANFKSTQLST